VKENSLSLAPIPEYLTVNLGLYIHIPFCQAKCSYCHFISFPYQRTMASRYQKAVLREIERDPVPDVDRVEVDTIYFGGGTPSLVPAKHIDDLLSACRSRFRTQSDCEVSIEANPGTISEKKIAALRKSGVNRISIGAQSFVDGELAAIGRLHTADMAIDALRKLTKSGFENMSVDLMLGLPLQTKESWKRSLDVFTQLEIPHISIYMLDLDEQCPLADLVADKLVQIPEEDLISDMYLETVDFLSSRGYMQYEISNFARLGHECRHNLKYWMRDPVHGFGLGSHSFDGIARYANKSHLDDYLRAIETGSSPRDYHEPISKTQALQENLFLGLRLTKGIDINQLRDKYGEEALVKYADQLRELSERGLVKRNGRFIRLSASGMLLSNEIFQLFV
jgi:oxygen-independent coproporphyrinogen-3 oxidase